MPTVYEYKGVSYELPDGLSNEAALAKIKASLGGEPSAQQVQEPQVPAETSTGPSIAKKLARQAGLAGRAMYEGFTAPATTVLEGVKGAYNLGSALLGSESRMPSAAKAQSQMLTQAGLPEPETMAERAAQAGMQGLVGGATAAKALPGTVFGQDLARQLTATAVAPAVAQPTAEVTKEITGSDLAATVAGLGVGVLTGSSAANFVGKLAEGKQPVLTMQDVKQRAGRAYTKVDDLGIVLSDQGAKDLLGKVSTDLSAARYLPENAPAVQTVLNKYESIVSKGNVSFNDVDQMRQLAGDLLKSSDKNIYRLGKQMTSSIDDYVANLSPKSIVAGQGGIDEAVKTIMSARKDWRNLSRATTLDDILSIADARALDPKASESELIRRGFINLVANKEKFSLFNKDEQSVIRKVASGGRLDDVLSLIARFNPERSQIMMGGAVAGSIAKPEIAIPVAGAGFAADKLQAYLRQQAAQQAMSGLLSGTTRSPTQSMNLRGLMSGATVPPLLE
jgi:hypothetical protein